MFPPRDDKFLFIALGAAAMAVVFAWQVGNQNGFNTAKHLVEQSRFGDLFRTSDDVRALSGTVTAVRDSSVTIQTVSENPFDSSPRVRTVIIAPATKITKLTSKDLIVYQKELDEFVKKVQSNPPTKDTQPPTPPEPFVSTDANLVDIKVGTMVFVTVSSNIKSVKRFVADEIRIQRQIMPQTIP